MAFDSCIFSGIYCWIRLHHLVTAVLTYMYQRRWRFQHLQLQTGNSVLSWIFSQQGLRPTFIRQWILVFLYQPYPHTLGNDDLGHLVQVHPCFYLTCDTFMIVHTPSVADWSEHSSEAHSEDDPSGQWDLAEDVPEAE